MTFGIYLPPQVLKGYPAPVLYFLSGLHGDGSELIRQTGIQRFAAQWNIIVVFPDTSPRGSHISDSTDEFIGQGADLRRCDRTAVGGALSDVQPYQPRTARVGGTAFPRHPRAQHRRFQHGRTRRAFHRLEKPRSLCRRFRVCTLVPPDCQPSRKASVCRLSGQGVGCLAGIRQHIAYSDGLTQTADTHRPRRR